MKLSDLLKLDPDLKCVFIKEDEFDVVTDFDEATHVIMADIREDIVKKSGLTNGKIYKIELDDDDYHVIDDNGNWNSVTILATSKFLLRRKY